MQKTKVKLKTDCSFKHEMILQHDHSVNTVTMTYSTQVTFIYIALFMIQIVSKQLYSDNRKIMQQLYTFCGIGVPWGQFDGL